MAAVADAAFDALLDYIDNSGDVDLHLVTTDPGLTYATVTGNDVGVSTAINLTGPADGDTSGRKITCPEQTITPNATDTATHWALTNGVDTVFASGALSSSVAVTSGVDVTVAAFTVCEVADATAL